LIFQRKMGPADLLEETRTASLQAWPRASEPFSDRPL